MLYLADHRDMDPSTSQESTLISDTGHSSVDLCLRIRYKSSPNIAWVKYWGKYNEDYILPLNDSLGLTLNSDDLATITICSFSKQHNVDLFILNGEECSIGLRMRTVLNRVREKAYELYKGKISSAEWSLHHFKVYSENTFPTAAGMASSASGFACLTTALNALFRTIFTQTELSYLARLGSGSASRSVYDGLVLWRGVPIELSNPSPSAAHLYQLSHHCISKTVKPSNYLSYIKVVILLTNPKAKDISSTVGMNRSTKTSELISLRKAIAGRRCSEIIQLLYLIDKAMENNDKVEEYQCFSRVAELICRVCVMLIYDSNQFHAICLDSYPPIFYLTEFSKRVISMVHIELNVDEQKPKIGYSFDAGAHAFLFMHKDRLHYVLKVLLKKYQLRKSQLNDKAVKVCQEIGISFDDKEGCFMDTNGYKGSELETNKFEEKDVYQGIGFKHKHRNKGRTESGVQDEHYDNAPNYVWVSDAGIGAHLFP